MQKFNTPAPISAVLDVAAGRVRFIAAERADTVVEVLPAAQLDIHATTAYGHIVARSL
ncbi:hypothetical protein [Microbispora rosea]